MPVTEQVPVRNALRADSRPLHGFSKVGCFWITTVVTVFKYFGSMIACLHFPHDLSLKVPRNGLRVRRQLLQLLWRHDTVHTDKPSAPRLPFAQKVLLF